MKKTLLSLLAICFAFAANAQEVCGYKATAYQGTWTGLTGATLVNTEQIDMSLSYPSKTYNEKCYGLDAETSKIVSGDALEGVKGFPIGFEFEYLGKKFTQFGICANGYICLGEEGQTMTYASSSSYWYKKNSSGKSYCTYAIGLYSNYLLSQVISKSSLLEDKDSYEILYKTIDNNGTKELVVEFKDAVMASSSSLDNANIYDESKCTVWSSQLHLTQNGDIYWVIKGLSQEGTSTNRGSMMMALTDGDGNYVTLTNSAAGTDFLTNLSIAANSGTTKKPQGATPDGWTIKYITPAETAAPEAQATIALNMTNVAYYGPIATFSTTHDGADNVLVIMSNGEEPNTDPTDGVEYAAGDVIGNATVVNPSSTNALFSGNNYFKAYAYNSFGKGGPKYNTTDAPVLNVQAYDPNCKAPTLEIVDKSYNDITVKAIPNEAGNKVVIAYSETADWDGYGNRAIIGKVTNDAVAGTVLKDENGNDCGKVAYVGAGNEPVCIAGLEPGKYYYFVAMSIDDNGYVTWNDVNCAAAAYDYTKYNIPTSFDFNHAPNNSVPFGWTASPTEEGELRASFWIPIQNSMASENSTDGSKIPMIECDRTPGEKTTYTFTSPKFNVAGNYVFNFDWKIIAWARFGTPPPFSGESWDEESNVKVQVIDGTDVIDLVTYTYENTPAALADPTAWVKESFDLSAYNGKDIKVQIAWTSNDAATLYFGIENVAILDPGKSADAAIELTPDVATKTMHATEASPVWYKVTVPAGKKLTLTSEKIQGGVAGTIYLYTDPNGEAVGTIQGSTCSASYLNETDADVVVYAKVVNSAPVYPTYDVSITATISEDKSYRNAVELFDGVTENVDFDGWYKMTVEPNTCVDFVISGGSAALKYYEGVDNVLADQGTITSTGNYTYTNDKDAAVVIYITNGYPQYPQVFRGVPAITPKVSQVTPTGINAINGTIAADGKYLENGKLVIVKNGKKFNAVGIEK